MKYFGRAEIREGGVGAIGLCGNVGIGEFQRYDSEAAKK